MLLYSTAVLLTLSAMKSTEFATSNSKFSLGRFMRMFRFSQNVGIAQYLSKHTGKYTFKTSRGLLDVASTTIHVHVHVHVDSSTVHGLIVCRCQAPLATQIWALTLYSHGSERGFNFNVARGVLSWLYSPTISWDLTNVLVPSSMRMLANSYSVYMYIKPSYM